MALTKVRRGGTDTGISDSSDATAITIDSSEKVGIGETSPLGKLHVKSADSGASANANFDDVVIEGSDHTGISILSGTAKEGGLLFGDSDDDNVGFLAYDHNTNVLMFGVNASERARIDGNGHFRVGTQTHSGGYMFNVSSPNIGSTYGGISIQNLADADGGYYMGFYKSNNTLLGKIIQNSSSVSYDTTSDYRLKENVVTDWDATTRLKQLKPSRFNFKGYKDETVDGFLAHEVSSIVPEAISGKKDAVDKDGNPEYQGIDHSKLVPLLTKALQEAVARIETLEAKVTALEAK